MKKIDIYIKNIKGELDLFKSVFHDDNSFDKKSFDNFLKIIDCDIFINFNNFNVNKLLDTIRENYDNFYRYCDVYKDYNYVNGNIFKQIIFLLGLLYNYLFIFENDN